MEVKMDGGLVIVHHCVRVVTSALIGLCHGVVKEWKRRW